MVVHGRVQGVFFRDTTRRRAVELGVSGWVCNNPDGTVEAALEGDGNAVDRMVRFAREGPRGAVVERVDVIEEPAEGMSGFRVL